MALNIAGFGALAGGFARGLSEAERLRMMQEQGRTAQLQQQMMRQSIQENNNRLGTQEALQRIHPENYAVEPREYALEGRTPSYEGMTGGLDEQDVPARTEGINVRTPGGVDRQRMYGDLANIYYRSGNPQAAVQLESLRDNTRYQETLRTSREALAMLGTGNIAGAAKVLQDTYNKIPNGVIAHAEPTNDGSISVRFFDPATSKVVKSMALTPDEVRQNVLMLTDPKAYQESISKGLERQKDIYVAQLNNLDKISPRDEWKYGTHGENHEPVLYSKSGQVVFPNALGGTSAVNRMAMDKPYKFAIEQISSEFRNIFRTTDLSQLTPPTRALALDANYFAQQALNFNWDRSDETGQIVRRTPSTLSTLGHGLAQLRNFRPDPKGGAPEEQQMAVAKQMGFEPVGGRLLYGREGSPYTFAMFRGKEFIVGSRTPVAGTAESAPPAATPGQAIPLARPGQPARELPTVRGAGAKGGPVYGTIRRPGE